MSLVVVLDACVLIPMTLRDTLLTAGKAHLYRMQTSDEILEEVRRNLIKTRINVTEESAQRLISTIKEKFDEALVTDYESRIPEMPINEKDRHVLAVAVTCGAQIIVTQNLKHFPQAQLAPFEIEALSADKFLIQLFHRDPEQIAMAITRLSKRLRNPPRTEEDILLRLERLAPNFVRLIRDELGFPGNYPWSHLSEIKIDIHNR